MSELAHDQFATASWQGNYDVYSVGPGEDTKMIRISLEAGTADLDAADTFKFIYLDSDTVVLGGWVNTDVMDSGGTTWEFDIGHDSDTAAPDPDFFYNGAGAASHNANFIAGIGATAAPFIPDDGDNYFITAVNTAAPTTAAAGTITVSLLLGCKQNYV
jgi:hypothetical protein